MSFSSISIMFQRFNFLEKTVEENLSLASLNRTSSDTVNNRQQWQFGVVILRSMDGNWRDTNHPWVPGKQSVRIGLSRLCGLNLRSVLLAWFELSLSLSSNELQILFMILLLQLVCVAVLQSAAIITLREPQDNSPLTRRKPNT